MVPGYEHALSLDLMRTTERRRRERRVTIALMRGVGTLALVAAAVALVWPSSVTRLDTTYDCGSALSQKGPGSYGELLPPSGMSKDEADAWLRGANPVSRECTAAHHRLEWLAAALSLFGLALIVGARVVLRRTPPELRPTPVPRIVWLSAAAVVSGLTAIAALTTSIISVHGTTSLNTIGLWVVALLGTSACLILVLALLQRVFPTGRRRMQAFVGVLACAVVAGLAGWLRLARLADEEHPSDDLAFFGTRLLLVIGVPTLVVLLAMGLSTQKKEG